MAFGVTPEGFVAKTLEEIKADIESEQKSRISPSINTSSASVIGQLNSIYANALRTAWELAQSVYSAGTIRGASGFALDLVAANTGTSRGAGTKSFAEATVNIDDGVTLPIGTRASVQGSPNSVFVTLAAVTNGTGVPADFTVNMEAEEFGPIVANAGTLNVKVDNIAGWNSVTNVEDATEGALRDSDFTLKASQRDQVAGPGTSPTDAIRANLLKQEGITFAKVHPNATGGVVDGIDPHSIEAVVFDGVVPTVADDTIAQLIWDNVAAGIGTSGLTSGTATDDEGFNHTVNFSRPSILDIYLEFDIQISNANYPDDGDTLIKQAVADFGDDNYSPGDNVILSKLCTVVHGIAGVTSIVETRVGIGPSPTQITDYITTNRQLADLDTGRIVINKV